MFLYNNNKYVHAAPVWRANLIEFDVEFDTIALFLCRPYWKLYLCHEYLNWKRYIAFLGTLKKIYGEYGSGMVI